MLNIKIRRNPYIKKIFSIFFILIALVCLYILVFKQSPPQNRVVLGNEIFLSRHLSEVQNQQLGLVVNHTSRLPSGTHIVDALIQKGALVNSLFSTEHGFLGDQEAGQVIHDSLYKGINVYSLHGNTKKPTPQQTRGLDAFVYDIQDVGARFYTYITTMKYILEAAAQENIPVYILDRPNPVSGQLIEGPVLDMNLESFTAPCPIPICYGLTCGELALMMKGENWIPKTTDIRVIEMKGWKRDFVWEDTHLPWIQTSPNIPKPDTALAYPGISLLGGIGLNHGIGTPNPFLQFGAPWLDPDRVIKSMDEKATQGIALTPISYTPRTIPGKTAYPPYKDRECQGFYISILEKEKFHSVEFTLELIRTLKTLFPDHIKVITERLDNLFGNEWLRQYVQGRLSYEQLYVRVKKDEETFRQKRKHYLIY